MSAIGTTRTNSASSGSVSREGRDTHGRRLVTETKAFYKTTEFVAYVLLLAGLLVAGAVTKAHLIGTGAHHADVFGARQVWLYATILTIGYMVSRGLAKAGSYQPCDEK